MSNATTSGNGPQPPITIDDVQRRFPEWDVTGKRDGFPLFSALKRPAPTTVLYVVRDSVRELYDRLAALEEAGQ
jgi:hypothetical protein